MVESSNGETGLGEEDPGGDILIKSISGSRPSISGRSNLLYLASSNPNYFLVVWLECNVLHICPYLYIMGLRSTDLLIMCIPDVANVVFRACHEVTKVLNQ